MKRQLKPIATQNAYIGAAGTLRASRAAPKPLSRRVHALGHGWDISAVPTSRTKLQTTLRVGSAFSPLEREADHVARTFDPSSASGAYGVANGRDGTVAASTVRLKARGGEAPEHVSSSALAAVESVVATAGRPLDTADRALYEPHFGADFSGVRVHSDERAAASAEQIGARAYTVDNHIVFGSGQFASGTASARSLMAHELTHVVQQSGGLTGLIQRDLAVPPTTPDAARKILSPAEISDAITFNQITITEAAEIQLLRDILGISSSPAAIDANFVQAVADYQILYGLPATGKVDGFTRRRLSREILGEADFLGFTGLGGLAAGVELRSDLDGLMTAGNTTYADWSTTIRAATVLQKDVILAEPAFLTRMRSHLSTWNDFARCVELLGRRAPTHNRLVANSTVSAALATAWTDSDVGVNPPLVSQHEEGGWVYLNLTTNRLSVRRQAAGATAGINLASPPIVADSIVVAKFHTHPNLGPAWAAGPSPQDTTVDTAHGVPDIVVGSNDTVTTTFDIFASGPNRRLHLAGNQGLPGSGGGLAPQAKTDGSHDEQ